MNIVRCIFYSCSTHTFQCYKLRLLTLLKQCRINRLKSLVIVYDRCLLRPYKPVHTLWTRAKRSVRTFVCPVVRWVIVVVVVVKNGIDRHPAMVLQRGFQVHEIRVVFIWCQHACNTKSETQMNSILFFTTDDTVRRIIIITAVTKCNVRKYRICCFC